jgi:Na+-transporting NADH:ubiquinone oxidoreductase subunit NqrC
MSNKTYHIKPSPDYRKAKSDWLTTVVGFILVFGVIAAVMVASILVGLPEK